MMGLMVELSLNHIKIEVTLHSVWKLPKKVAFNIASEASYVYILSAQKFIKIIKMPKMV